MQQVFDLNHEVIFPYAGSPDTLFISVYTVVEVYKKRLSCYLL
jgi:hypothetical protein